MPAPKSRISRIREILTQPVGKPRAPKRGRDAAVPARLGENVPLADPPAYAEPLTPGLGAEPLTPLGPDLPPVPGAPAFGAGAPVPYAYEEVEEVEEVPVTDELAAADPAFGLEEPVPVRAGAGRGPRGRRGATPYRRAARPPVRRRRVVRRTQAPLLSRFGALEVPEVSRTLVVLLLAAVLLIVLWLVALQPGDSTQPAQVSIAVPTPTVHTTPTVGTPNHIAPRRPHTVHRAGLRPGVPHPGTLNQEIISAIHAHRVVAVLVINPGTADDEAVRAELDGLGFSPRQVLRVVVPTSQLAQLPVITASVSVNQTPTFILINHRRVVSTIVGFADAFELSTRIGQALRT